jgi:hypothetical protein
MANNKLQTWELWYPNAAATGLLFARCRIDPAEVLWVHAAPPNLAVVVRDGDDGVIARGEPLELVGESTPMTRLRLDGNGVTREDLWPSDADLGATVLLPGGEAGTLQGWWNAGDHSQWRWQVEFYNHR